MGVLEEEREEGKEADVVWVEWNTIAGLIEEYWDLYDGFVILSGTDTLVNFFPLRPLCLLTGQQG